MGKMDLELWYRVTTVVVGSDGDDDPPRYAWVSDQTMRYSPNDGDRAWSRWNMFIDRMRGGELVASRIDIEFWTKRGRRRQTAVQVGDKVVVERSVPVSGG